MVMAYKLPDDYVMVWDRPSGLTANTGYTFRFRLLDAQGRPAADMEPYMGMGGHAAFVETMGTNPVLRFARSHLAGKPGISRYGTADEHPLTKADLAGLRDAFGAPAKGAGR